MTPELFVKMSLDAWNQQLQRMNKTFGNFSDEELQLEVAPGRNRVIYLLGHMAAVHDRMMPLLGIGERFYPQLDEAFIANPDKAIKEIPDAATLRKYWEHVNEVLTEKLNSLPAADWFKRHTSVSEEDFAKEPHRNRLNVLLSRTSHIASHQGQIILAKKA